MSRIFYVLSRTTFWILSTLALITCGGSDDENDAQSSCETMCAKFELCDSSTDESDCVEECAADRGYSNAAFSAYAGCVEDVSCDELFYMDDVDDCMETKIANLTLSNTVKDFCADLASALDACNSDFDEREIEDNCRDFAGMLNDDYVKALGECLDEPCDSIEDCFEDAADRFETEAELDVGVAYDAYDDDDECCASNDPCDWANDGYCDCEGTQSWDAADC